MHRLCRPLKGASGEKGRDLGPHAMLAEAGIGSGNLGHISLDALLAGIRAGMIA